MQRGIMLYFLILWFENKTIMLHITLLLKWFQSMKKLFLSYKYTAILTEFFDRQTHRERGGEGYELTDR